MPKHLMEELPGKKYGKRKKRTKLEIMKYARAKQKQMRKEETKKLITGVYQMWMASVKSKQILLYHNC